MARHARSHTLYDGCFAHIYSRALEKRTIFRDREDFEYFKSVLRQTAGRYGYRIHHYCLMHTHFHMIASLAQLNSFSLALKELKQSYAKRFQEKHEKKGPVWWGRFGSQLIESERYLYACGLYIEMNPVKAGMVEKAEDWEYSSSRHYFLGEADDLVSPYEKPSLETAMELTEGLNVCRGAYIGSPVFILNRGE
jgi:putative transposase